MENDKDLDLIRGIAYGVQCFLTRVLEERAKECQKRADEDAVYLARQERQTVAFERIAVAVETLAQVFAEEREKVS